ncbi:hypothetical protein GN958_ATG02457 [Phytophthora infestans]|uniref:Uncharacterized protein n=1 Tax=Phytophthora infestans TaxID=4787 RepID=A0A8S9V5E1_PHYIN|nr:hypothetical protein GN958_ATG02457 [Phytophthora infestans]
MFRPHLEIVKRSIGAPAIHPEKDTSPSDVTIELGDKLASVNNISTLKNSVSDQTMKLSMKRKDTSTATLTERIDTIMNGRLDENVKPDGNLDSSTENVKRTTDGNFDTTTGANVEPTATTNDDNGTIATSGCADVMHSHTDLKKFSAGSIKLEPPK